MPEKLGIVPPPSPWLLRSNPLLQWRFHLLTVLVFIGMVTIWSVDASTVKDFIESWRFKQQYLGEKLFKPPNLAHEDQIPQRVLPQPSYSLVNNSIVAQNFTDGNLQISSVNTDEKEKEKEEEEEARVSPEPNIAPTQNYPVESEWLSTVLEPDFSVNLLSRWLAPGGSPCKDSPTADIVVFDLDGHDSIELAAGKTHEFVFQAVDESGNRRCSGGDYFETDLSGEWWKSRPLVKDFGNGSYSFSVQVHPDFTGDYNLTVILLFRHFEGLKFSTTRFVFNKELRKVQIKFVKSNYELPKLELCEKSDFGKDLWTGRWTRHGKNDDCRISNDGRYRCLSRDYPCRNPWCDGSLGALESNGWVYSSHCSFRLFKGDSAWNCLKNRWIFFWGDSNHVDSIRNLLNFVLDLPEIKSVPRRFDMHFTNPKDASQSVRITSIFNAHWNETLNYQGLNSLRDKGFRDLLKKYFSEETVPDTIIMNSGLHDGIFWQNIRRFSGGVDYAVSFWNEVMESIKQRGLVPPQIIYRTTIATGGYARELAFNPSKMEAFNWMVLDKFRKAGLITSVVDNFDMTFPWHYDNRCNDGVHYGRAPAKMKWRDGEIGHQYFVDLMLVHVLLNVLCPK
ncbi:hypothetical protein M5689_005686 [Euphorbia peplus]|nr:hypothetical protein M5689_005686 [Euphorbia peplus]